MAALAWLEGTAQGNTLLVMVRFSEALGTKLADLIAEHASTGA